MFQKVARCTHSGLGVSPRGPQFAEKEEEEEEDEETEGGGVPGWLQKRQRIRRNHRTQLERGLILRISF